MNGWGHAFCRTAGVGLSCLGGAGRSCPRRAEHVPLPVCLPKPRAARVFWPPGVARELRTSVEGLREPFVTQLCPNAQPRLSARAWGRLSDHILSVSDLLKEASVPTHPQKPVLSTHQPFPPLPRVSRKWLLWLGAFIFLLGKSM